MPRLSIPFPTELRPRLPTIVGNVDYLTLRQGLEQIDQLLRTSGVEEEFVELALQSWLEGSRTPTAREQQRFQLRSRRALRCTVLRTLQQSRLERRPVSHLERRLVSLQREVSRLGWHTSQWGRPRPVCSPEEKVFM